MKKINTFLRLTAGANLSHHAYTSVLFDLLRHGSLNTELNLTPNGCFDIKQLVCLLVWLLG